MATSTLRKTVLSLALAAVLGTLGCSSESVESLVASGDAALAKGDYRTAEIQLKSALQKDLNNVRARWLLGEVSLATEDGESAEKEIRRAGELGVGNDAVIPGLAQALLLQNKVDAVLDLAQPPDLSPRSRGEVMAAQGLALLVKGEKGRADELTGEALRLAPDAKFARTARARVLIDAGKLDEAEQLLAVVQQNYPDDGLAWSLMGNIRELRGDWQKAEEAYSAAIAKRANDAPDLLKRAGVRLAQMNLDGALADSTRLNQAAPYLQRAWYITGLAHFQKKDFPKAQEALDRSYQLANDHLSTLILLAASNLSLGNLGQASAQASRAFAIAPNVVGPRLLLATIHLREKQPQRAEELIRPVVDAMPDILPAKRVLADSLQAQGKGAEAAPLLEQIAAASPESLDVQTLVGTELLRAKEPEKAVAVLQQAVKSAPEAPEANAALVTALLKDKKFDDALAAAKRFHEQRPNDPEALRLLGTAQLATGDREGGKASFRKGLEVAPGDPMISLVLADVRAREGDANDARRILEESSNRHPDDPGLYAVLATIAIRENRAADAVALLRKALAKNPSHRPAQLLLAQQLIAQKDPKGALAVLPTEPGVGDAAVLLLRGDARLQSGEAGAARDDFERLVALAPRSGQAHFKLAGAYASLGDQGRMDKALETAASLAPADADIVLSRARTLAARGKVEEAQSLAVGLGLPESDVRLLTTQLLIAEKKGDQAGRVQLARRLQEVAPSSQNAQQLAQAQFAAGQSEAAEQTLRAWMESHPDADNVALTLADLLNRVGRASEAAAVLRPLAEKHPKNAAVLNNLAWYLRESAPQEALAVAKQAIALAPDNLSVVDTYATVLALNGDFEMALRTIDGAIQKAKDPAYFRLQRVAILERKGDKAAAAEELEAVEGAGLSPELQAKAEALGRSLGEK